MKTYPTNPSSRAKLTTGHRKLGEVCKIQKGKKPELYDVQTKNRLPYLEAKFMRGTKEAKFAEKDDKNSVPVNTNDLIIICDGSKSGDVFSGFEGVLSSTMGRIDFDEKQVEKVYLELFLKMNFDLFNSSKKGAAIPHLDFAIFNDLEIPLPPLSEQKKIVAKLKRVLAKISEAKKLRAEARENADNLLPAELHKIFEEGRESGWEEYNLGEILELCDSGTWGDESPSGMPLLRSTNMQNGELVLGDVKYIDVPKEKIERYTLREGDILMTKSSGSVDHIGKSLFITKEMDRKYGFSDFTQRLRVNQKLALPKWVYFKISSSSTRNFLLGASQTTTGLRNLKIPVLKELRILIPSLTEQKKIVAYLDSLSEKIGKIKKLQFVTQNDLFALEQSVLSQAFS